MKKVIIALLMAFYTLTAIAQSFEKDIIKTPDSEIEIMFIGHGTLMVIFGSKVIHIDPFSRLADYTKLPKADILFLTHHHQDHLPACNEIF